MAFRIYKQVYVQGVVWDVNLEMEKKTIVLTQKCWREYILWQLTT